MDKKRKRWVFRLDLFDGGAAGGGAGTGADGGTASGTGVTGSVAANQAQGVEVSGGQDAAAVNPEQDRAKAFEDLIKGEYKDQYDKRVQDTIKRRLRSTQAQVDAYNALSPTLEMLYSKYGVNAGDIEALNQAIADDDTYYEEEALNRGMTVQQLKEIKKIERENADLRRQMQEQETRENADKLYAQWMQEAEQIQQIYPSFSMDAEMQNPQFVDLLRNHIDMRTAYEVIHKDDIIAGAMQFATKTAEQKITNKLMANQSRPVENGMSGVAASVNRIDVSTMTKQQRDEIRRRVQMGERIVL